MGLIHIRRPQLTRRQFLHLSGISSVSLLLGGCGTPALEDLVGTVSQPLNQKLEKLIFNPQKLVPEFSPNEIQPEALIVNSFRSTPIIDVDKYRLIVDGEVNHPLNMSMAEIQNLPLTSMIIRHICVEGWAAIVQWGGVQLREIIALAQPKENVQYVYFKSADGYYESWDIASALHPQTLLAYEKNGESLPIDNGAPLRLAAPIKLGYKQSKWVTQITLASHLSIFKGYWEDQGYEWFAGI
ncbi:Oxidoreductase, molybdopterin binding protein [Trichormus variabilis ATCC 29413]|uniref:Oxidoreductase, molybdopterin binding protein n=2 Tax=Anabaena variabilis TaxID=264691 RepID=Q3MEK4_TRIV2|nr:MULTISPECIES: molybdopterin-binding protein [Nostocaceae]ABA20582.1 Oxidoreductase, molybdopterin binding protein [Trichormus variabilis ATCC 29413]MBC1214005.1 molybdopterin-dependent oxidoreductase [Trichormus variabilis ARAD]MBC1254317.1 molybdopterin-dependent oxidoreductase [Trichormus variabilis V5]MBC1269292.1 molybdopterin-dependent oxidoreductase [Trichormus variabilis FSR]MBC1300775.1 molybdopterin-dependent oxidoreductase [Trichormus variabilis N2B]